MKINKNIIYCGTYSYCLIVKIVGQMKRYLLEGMGGHHFLNKKKKKNSQPLRLA